MSKRVTTTTTTTLSPEDSAKQESIDKAVADVFDEFLTEISTKVRLHPSEQVDRDNHISNCNNSKLYDIINSYHAYCKICERHFYSRSVANDINSFFQNHLNTSYHRQQRAGGICNEDTPILTWDRPLHSAKCHVCELSGLKAFVISTKFCVKKLIRQHMCAWTWEQRETNERFLKKLNLLRRYCGLKIFREKFLKKINGREVCLLCGLNLPWSKEKASCHLRSDMHYQKFCMFVWMNFTFAPKDILNGFNLETVTRWLIVYDLPVLTSFGDCPELISCLNDVNNGGNPYPEDKRNTSYSPAFVEMLLGEEEIDFIHKNKCLLCNVELTAGHFGSSMHRTKAVGLRESSFSAQNYSIYQQNKAKRLLPYEDLIDSYSKLGEQVKEKMKAEKTCPPNPVLFLKTMLAGKLTLVERVMTRRGNDRELFCHVCDQMLQKSFREAHLGGDEHKAQLEKWNELRESFDGDRFLEPFKKIKNVIMCLLCGAVIHTNSFFSHLKGGNHARRLELYLGLNCDVPISSAFKFREDFSCWCTVCNSLMSRNKSLKATLKNIRYHWPCSKKKERKKALTGSEMEVVDQQDVGLGEAMAGQCEDQEDETEEEGLAGVEKTVESAKTKETKMNNVLEKSVYLSNCLSNARLVDAQIKARRRSVDEERLTSVAKQSVSNSVQGSGLTCSCTASKCACPKCRNGNEKKKEVLRGKRREMANELRTEAKEGHSISDQDSDEDKGDTKREVLLIRGLPKRKRKYSVIYPLFEVFGKIKYLLFDSKEVVLAFDERGNALAAAMEAKNILQEPKLAVMVAERMLKKKKGKTVGEVTLDEDIISLLQDPQQLMDFVLCLVFQAMKASKSPVETKREEMVCNMIVQTALEKFPYCRCYPFGSRLTGLSLSNSDLDVFLDCGGMYEGFKNTTPGAEKSLVRTVAYALRKVAEVSDIIVVDSARVPIVSFHHKPTNLDCDISFKNGLSIQNSMLIKFLVSLDWRVTPMILFMKYWANQNGLHGSPYFSSYALSMLVINYLEQLESPVLPTIESLQNSYVGRRVTIGGWDCSINTNKSILPKLENKDPLPVLLEGMFDYYANFDFNKNVVFPLSGKILSRKAFSESGKGELPMCFKRHIINVPVPIENLVSERFPICIVDPFDLSHVLTKSFTCQGLSQFTYFCQMSRQYLKKGMTDSLSH